MVLVKWFLLLATTIAQEYSLTPPNPRPPAEELHEHSEPSYESKLLPMVRAFRIITRIWVALEGLVLFAFSGYCPSILSRPLLHILLGPFASGDPTTTASVLAALKAPNSAFVSGTILIVTGALLRVHTFRVLGPRFTFELSIRGARAHSSVSDSANPTKAHMLVTHGIYSIIRHPSYTGGLVAYTGWFLCLLDRQGLAVTLASASLAWCQWWWYGYEYAPWWGIHIAAATTVALVCSWRMAMYWVTMVARMDVEDAMLKNHFGEEWRTWAKRVPWRLVPGVY